MKSQVLVYLPFVLSAISIYMMVLAGNLSKNAWAVGLFNQVLWFTWIVLSGNWGFLPLTIAMCIVYARNHWKWKKNITTQ